MLYLVGKQGYDATTVPQVVTSAKTSRNAFYALFSDKEDCYLQLCIRKTEHFADDILESSLKATRWEETVAIGIRAALQWWQDRPALAKAVMVELQILGEQAVATRRKIHEPFERMLKLAAALARATEPQLPPISSGVPHLLILMITEVIAETIRAGEGHQLTGLAEELSGISISALIGPQPRQARRLPIELGAHPEAIALKARRKGQ